VQSANGCRIVLVDTIEAGTTYTAEYIVIPPPKQVLAHQLLVCHCSDGFLKIQPLKVKIKGYIGIQSGAICPVK